MNVKSRIKNFIQLEEISIIEFEKSINASNGYVNSIHKSIGLDKLNNIIEKYPNLNIEWLLTGNGEMIKSEKKIEIKAIDNEWILKRFEELVVENTLLKKEVEELRTTRGKSTNAVGYPKLSGKIGTHLAAEPKK